MSRYIDADKLQYELAEAFDNFDPNWLVGRKVRQVILKIKKFVDKNATLDVHKVRHGNWVYGEFDVPHCSECGIEVVPCNISNYCPHCGAKMESEQE